MTTRIIRPGGLVVLDPSEERFIGFDWDSENLAPGATIVSSTFTITVIRQSGATALTLDTQSILSNLRSTQVRLLATTAAVGDEYELANRIVTSETPAQTKEQRVRVLIQD